MIDIPIAIDSFARCEKCKKWVRLEKEDEEGMRTIPLFNIVEHGKIKWVCEECFDKVNEIL